MMSVIEQAHRQAVLTPLAQIVNSLTDLFSNRFVCYVLGVDSKTATRWANGTTVDIRVSNETVLRAFYEIVCLISITESRAVARAWFIGMNPELDDVSPAETLHGGKIAEVYAAAHSFISE